MIDRRISISQQTEMVSAYGEQLLSWLNNLHFFQQKSSLKTQVMPKKLLNFIQELLLKW